MLEQLRITLIEKRPYIAFLIGVAYVFIAFFTSKIFFPSIISVATLFLVTLLLVPTVIRLMGDEEKRERNDGVRNFLKDHKDIFEVYVFLFIGIFAGALLLAWIAGISNFSYQLDFLKNSERLSSELVKNRIETGIQPSIGSFLGLLENNLLVIIICFFLSLFYGAGAMFLIVLNASIFSTFVAFVMRELPTATHRATLLGIFSVHMVPELLGFLLAAIAGGVISKAVMREKFLSQQFKNVMKDALVLFVISAIIIVIAAFLETYVTTSLFNLFLAK
jgi:uncharacterized membrane protein SpoIIM required for sporulation